MFWGVWTPRDGMPNLYIVRPSGLLFFRARINSFHTHASLLTVFVCLYNVFIPAASMRVFRKTLVHEFHISYSHTE